MEQGFEFGEDLLDGVQVWAVGWQEQELGAGLAKRFAHCRAFMAAEIIHDDDVTGRQCRYQHLLDVCDKSFAVDRPVQYERGIDTI